MCNNSSEEQTTNPTTPLRFSILPDLPTLSLSKAPSKADSRSKPAAEYRPLKLVKRGFVDNAVPLMCGIRFESSPAWFWALRLSDWEAIYITDTDELRLRQYHQPTWLHTKDKLRIVRAKHNRTQPDTASVWFLSGSRGYLDKIEIPDGVPSSVIGLKDADGADHPTQLRRGGSVSPTRRWGDRPLSVEFSARLIWTT
jgi:hypothetical protein